MWQMIFYFFVIVVCGTARCALFYDASVDQVASFSGGALDSMDSEVMPLLQDDPMYCSAQAHAPLFSQRLVCGVMASNVCMEAFENDDEISESDDDDEGPSPKKKKLEQSAYKSFVRAVFNDLRLYSSRKKGCKYATLSQRFPPEDCSPEAVLAVVMDAVFQAKRQVLCAPNSYYLLPEDTPKVEIEKPCSVAMAEMLLLHEDPKEKKPSILAYRLSRQGYTAKNFSQFCQQLFGVCVLCQIEFSDVCLDRAQELYMHLRTLECWRTRKLASVFPDYVQLGGQDQRFVFAILRKIQKIPVEEYDIIGRLAQCQRRDSVRSNHCSQTYKMWQDISISIKEEASSTGWIKAFLKSDPYHDRVLSKDMLKGSSSGRAFILQVMKVVFAEDLFITYDVQREVCTFFNRPNPREIPTEDVAIFVKDLLFSGGHAVPFGDVAWMVYDAGYRCGSISHLRNIYDAVRCVCNIDVAERSTCIKRFVRFVQSKKRPEDQGIAEAQTLFEQESGECLGRVAVNVARYILSMRPEVFAKLYAARMPGPDALDYFYRSSRKVDLGRETLASLKQKICNLAQKNKTIQFKTIKKLLPNNLREVDVLKLTFDVVFSNEFNVEVSGDMLSFSLHRRQNPEPLVPLEVVIAARFGGWCVSGKERGLFANAVYSLGYPIREFDDFSVIFDAVCVACDISVRSFCELNDGKLFFKYVQKAPQEKRRDWDFLKERYKAPVTSYMLNLVKNANVLEEMGVLKTWGIGLCRAPFQIHTRALFLKILHKYAEHERECSSEILGLITPFAAHPYAVFKEVMGMAFNVNSEIVYNRERDTYRLAEGERPMYAPPLSLGTFVEQTMLQDPALDVVDMIVLVYKAGYRVGSIQCIEDFFNIYKFKCTTDMSCVRAKRCLEEAGFAARKCKSSVRDLRGRLLSDRRQMTFSKKEWAFLVSCACLMHQGEITVKSFAQATLIRAPLSPPKSAVSPLADADGFGAQQIKAPLRFVVRVPRRCLGLDVNVDLFVKTQKRAPLDKVWDWREIKHFAPRCSGPVDVLAFVLDAVFKKGLTMTYTPPGAYVFDGVHQDARPYEPAQSVVLRYFSGRACCREDGVKCIYEVYKSGNKYDSFQLALGAICAICVQNGIDVSCFDEACRRCGLER